ncbi:hypothetical protein HEB94_005405 [Actinopolymorpha pittospori]|uniref:Uncharacterized protein n=1 Tax=Actinopolymorpha pittospori TaxID=648752 RepID=A0A927MYI6_9ACTN|nr:hypothetical protein [Actinopolymorpha pittospori]MBE1608557.1 hypothetical protein [Actinopolymorpha pittospori]
MSGDSSLVKCAPDDGCEGVGCNREVVRDVLSVDQAAVWDLELWFPGGEFDVCTPQSADEHRPLVLPGDAYPASEPEEPGLDDDRAGFFEHLPAEGVFPALGAFWSAGGKLPPLAVAANEDNLAGGGHADAF